MNGVANKYKDSESLGVAKVKKFTITEEEAKRNNMFMFVNFEPYFMRVHAGEYVKLSVNGELMMSDTDMERLTNNDFVSSAHGEVMIAGLGIGLVLEALREKCKTGEVTRIVVYEKYQDVIDLVAWRYKDLPLEVRYADILEYKPAKGEMYDTIYFDIWPTICDDNLNDIAKLHQRWKFRKRKGGYMDSWMCHYLRARRASERRY